MGSALIALGSLISLVGWILLVIAGFRVSIVWGLANIFCCPAMLIFVFMHWQECKNGFLIYIVGMLVQGAGVGMTGGRHPLRGKPLSETSRNLE